MPDGPQPDEGTVAAGVNLANIVKFGHRCAVPLVFWLVPDRRRLRSARRGRAVRRSGWVAGAGLWR